MAVVRKALFAAALVLAVVAHVRAAGADADADAESAAAAERVRAQTVVAADATTWAHLSHEQLMALSVWGADPCTREAVPGFDYAHGFAEFCKRFGKVYAANTYALRFAAWKASYNCVYFKNRTAPKRSYYLRMNHLNDHTREEFLKKLGARESAELVGTPAQVPGPDFQLRTTTPTLSAPGHGPSAAHRFRQTFADAQAEADAAEEADELDAADADEADDESEAEAEAEAEADEDLALLQTGKRVRTAKRARVGGDNHSGQSFDWRAKGVINPIGYQQNCGNCYAFSAAAVAEAAWAIAGNALRKVSVAQITDCAPKPAKGCAGGMSGEALNSLMKAGGFCADTQYPFRGYSDTCQACDKVVQLVDVPRNYFTEKNESSLYGYLAVSPVSVALVASPVSFMNYGGGVYDAAECNAAGVRTNHALTLVGYGTDPEHGDYWIVRNQWATSWGENGYMRLKRGVNQCKIANGLWAIAKSKPAAELGLVDAPSKTPPPPGPDAAPLSPCAATDPNSKVTFHGTCQDVQACTDAKMYPQPKLCSGSPSIQCCLRVPLTGPAIPAPVAPAVAPATPAAVPATPPRPVQQSCSALHPTRQVVATGACIDAGICNAANNVAVAGACPGTPANVKCCLSK